MGMAPALAAVVWPALITAAGAIGSRIFAPQGQELSSFEGASSIAPDATLGNAQQMLNGVMGQFLQRAGGQPDLSHAYVQDLPSFSGGGLPMPVGVTGSWEGGAMPHTPPPTVGELPDWFTPGQVGHGQAVPRNPDIDKGTPRDPNNPQPIPPTHPNPPDDPRFPRNPGSHQPSGEKGGPAPSSLLGAMDEAPRRLAFQPPGTPAAAGSNTAMGGGQGMADPQAIGAVSLLMHLASGRA